ncbi:uncharacterized protein LOC104912655 [Meleagris gallopavo]|uniref:uncharacterized protein LOC104912655 n=1 Tax=Meleagris gallopavo TaxID=9103 RepID=UPI000549DCEA|nr:uncharacterized protein LOC104912655 [Meleagris gallopavo]
MLENSHGQCVWIRPAFLYQEPLLCACRDPANVYSQSKLAEFCAGERRGRVMTMQAVKMSDGKNNQEFQMGQLEEKHAEDDNKKVLDSLNWESHVLTCDFQMQSLFKSCAKQHVMRKFFVIRCSLIWPGVFDQTILGPCHEEFRGNITELFAVEWEVMKSLESGCGADMYDGLVERRQACERCNMLVHLRYVNIKQAPSLCWSLC